MFFLALSMARLSLFRSPSSGAQGGLLGWKPVISNCPSFVECFVEEPTPDRRRWSAFSFSREQAASRRRSFFDHFLERFVLFVCVLLGFPSGSHALDKLFCHLQSLLFRQVFGRFLKFGRVDKLRRKMH